MVEIISIVLNAVLGGGLIVTLVTLRQTRDRATEDVGKARAEKEKMQLDNVEQATRILMSNIVEPLKKEINGIRREMARLRRCIDKANGCPHADDCLVLGELRKQQADDGTDSDASEGARSRASP